MSERDEIKEWGDALRAASEGGLAKALRVGATRVALSIQRQAQINATTSPKVRSGMLRRSIVGSVEAEGPKLSIVIRAGGGAKQVKYARMQEEGGTVKPTRAKFLAIPLPAARTKAGVSRYKSPRDAGDLRMIPIKRGRFLLVRKVKAAKGRKRRGKPKMGEALFLLTREPQAIKPTRFLARAVNAGIERLGAELGDVIRVDLEKEPGRG